MIRGPVHSPLRLTDAQLLAECDVHTYRASGPGGQKRNKVESAIRLRHRPTGVAAIAEDSRSQLENRPLAVRRLREAIAVRVRSPVDLSSFRAPPELVAAVTSGGRLRVSPRHPDYPLIAATVLDVLEACAGRASQAAQVLGLTTHHLIQFLEEHPRVWQEAGRVRLRHGQRPLRSSS